jgi:hypothetical protein
VAGFKSERVAGFKLECMAGFVGIRNPASQQTAAGIHQPALRLAQQQQPNNGRLDAAVEIYCEFLAVDSWQVEGARRIVGRGVGLIAQGKAIGHRFAM